MMSVYVFISASTYWQFIDTLTIHQHIVILDIFTEKHFILYFDK